MWVYKRVENLHFREVIQWTLLHIQKYLDHTWNEFVSILFYKASQACRQIIEIDPKNTTKNCSNPNCKNKATKKLSDRIHRCGKCGLEIDRDLNASINI